MAALTALTVLAAVGTGISTYQGIRAGKAAKQGGKAERAAAESQAELAEFNADVAELQAKDALERGAEEESAFRASVRGIIGSQRARFAAGNVDVGFGSALDVQADAAYLGELDALAIRNDAARAAWGFEIESQDYRKRAEIARREGVYLEKAGNERAKQNYIGAAGSFVSGASSYVQNRYGWGR